MSIFCVFKKKLPLVFLLSFLCRSCTFKLKLSYHILETNRKYFANFAVVNRQECRRRIGSICIGLTIEIRQNFILKTAYLCLLCTIMFRRQSRDI